MPTEIRFGTIGLGLMGREFASAAARWIHLSNLDFAMSWRMDARRCDSRFIAPRLKKRIRAI